MPYQPPNFLGVNIENDFRNKGLGDLFGDILKHRKAEYETRIKGTEAKYAEPNAREKLTQAMIKSQYAEDTAKADIASKNAYANNAGTTSTVKDLIAAGYTPGTKEFQEAMQKQYGVGQTPKEGVPGSLAWAPAVQQNQTINRMNEELKNAEDGEYILYNVKKFKELNEKYPDMWDDFNQLFSLDNPSEVLSLKQILLKRYAGDKEKISAIDLASKYANNIALKSGTKFGKNFTDAKLKAIEKGKMSGKYTKEVNDEIANDLEHEYSYIPKYKEALDKGLNEYSPVSPNYDNYRMVTIKNRKTGEYRTVTKKEAREMKAKELK